MPIYKWPVTVHDKYQFIAFNIRIPPSRLRICLFFLSLKITKNALTPVEDFYQISVYPPKNRVSTVSEEYESTPEEFHDNLRSIPKEFITMLLYPKGNP